MIRKIINALWVLLAVALIAIVVVFVSISKGWIGYMPPVEELKIPIINLQLRYSRKMGKYWVPSQWKKTIVYTAAMPIFLPTSFMR